jgi:mono/diheme cytochrome c family protein
MRRLFRWVVRIVAVLVAVVAGGLGYVYFKTSREMAAEYRVTVPAIAIPTDAASIERGRYIAERISMCTDCHGKDLGGKMVADNFAMGRLAAANLTRGKGGIGSRYTDADFVRVLVHGVRPDGRSVVFMPSADYQFTKRAIGELIAYVKSVPPVDREWPRPQAGPMARVLAVAAGFPLSPAALIDHEHATFAEEQTADDPAAQGAQLVAMAGCRGCHGPDLTGGGGPPPGASNITPTGISHYTQRDFVTAIREHKRPNGSTINDAMPRAYGEMSDPDLASIFAYLQTVPPAGKKSKNQQ